MLRLAAALLVAPALAACATTTPATGPVETGAQVTGFTLRLDDAEDGRVDFTLGLGPGAPVSEVEWELSLDRLKVASGFEQAPAVSQGAGGRQEVRVGSPLVFRGVPWVAGSAFVRVELRGVVRLGRPGVDERRFRDAREVLVKGLPALERQRD